MIDIVVFLVFSIVMLLFMAFPAIKISEYLEKKLHLTSKTKNRLIVVITIALSLLIGLFLKFEHL